MERKDADVALGKDRTASLSLSLFDSISSFSSEMRIAFSLIRVIRPGYVTRKREEMEGKLGMHACSDRNGHTSSVKRKRKEGRKEELETFLSLSLKLYQLVVHIPDCSM